MHQALGHALFKKPTDSWNHSEFSAPTDSPCHSDMSPSGFPLSAPVHLPDGSLYFAFDPCYAFWTI